MINGRLVVAGRPLDPDEHSTLHHSGDEGEVIWSVLELGEHPLGHVHPIEPLPNDDLLVGRYWDRSMFVVGAAQWDIAVDPVGVPWALSQLPRDDWRERAGDDDNPPPDARVRAVIEALDSATGEVLGHLEVDAFPVLMVRGGEVVLFQEQVDPCIHAMTSPMP